MRLRTLTREGLSVRQTAHSRVSGNLGARDSSRLCTTPIMAGPNPGDKGKSRTGDTFDLVGLLLALWKSIANKHPYVEDITVIGIDLSKRFD
jgi:hypothetical protein